AFNVDKFLAPCGRVPHGISELAVERRRFRGSIADVAARLNLRIVLEFDRGAFPAVTHLGDDGAQADDEKNQAGAKLVAHEGSRWWMIPINIGIKTNPLHSMRVNFQEEDLSPKR